MDGQHNGDKAVRKAIARLRQSATKLKDHLTLTMEIIMADAQALQDKIDELAAAVQADQDGDAAIVARLSAKIAELQAQVDAGTPVDTQVFIDELEAIKASLQPAE